MLNNIHNSISCASWSPKGKQIAVGFPNGKLAQYKPDLKLARTIPCAVNAYAQPYDVVSLQWLSTYQFAAVFLAAAPRQSESLPAIFIINAPKNVAPTYINYDDICFSQMGPRPTQVYLSHILLWNLILVASANSMEIGVLGTRDTGTETPLWTQYIMLDEARAELPLLAATKQETYPVGMAIELGCTHQLTINETLLLPMPMLHLLSTAGLLLSFDIINRLANVPNICSPPRPIADQSGAFRTDVVDVKAAPVKAVQPTGSEISFGMPANMAATSTPTVVTMISNKHNHFQIF